MCTKDIEDYFKHVSSPEHLEKFLESHDGRIMDSGFQKTIMLVDEIDKMFEELRVEKAENMSQEAKFNQTTRDISGLQTVSKIFVSSEDLPKPTPFFGGSDPYFNQKSYISGKDKPKKYLSKKDVNSKNNSQETEKDEKISVVTKTVV